MFSEVTVQVLCDFDEAAEIIKARGFKLSRRYKMHDTYWAAICHLDRTYKELMERSFLVRKFDDNYGDRITYKQKIFDKNGNVISEQKTDCVIQDAAAANKIFALMKLNNWVQKTAEVKVFKKDGFEVCFQIIDAIGIFIEIEQEDCNDIAGLITFAKSLGLPLGEDFHVQLPYLVYLKSLA